MLKRLAYLRNSSKILSKLSRHAQSIEFLEYYPENTLENSKIELTQLFNFGVIYNPISIMYIARDFEKNTWVPNVAVVYSENFFNFLKLYFTSTGRLLVKGKEFKISDFIFDYIPTIKALKIIFEDAKKLKFGYSLSEAGSIETLTFEIPPIEVNLPATCGPNGEFQLKMERFGDLRERIMKVDPTQKEKLEEFYLRFQSQENEFIQKLTNEIKGLFKGLGELTDNMRWSEVEARTIECFSKAIALLSLAKIWGVERVKFYVTRDFRGNSHEISSGGIIVYEGKDTEVVEDLLEIYLGLKNRAKTLKQLLTLRNKHALRSAIAAIMARNMSHNIGSHTLATVSATKYNFNIKDDQILYSFLQHRMDFIAQISTEFPAWSFPCWFVRELMREFYRQKHLLNYIAVSEGLKCYKYNYPSSDKKQLKINIVTNKECVTDIKESEKNKAFENDCLLSIPGGMAGNQAFYTILENIIRNAAKHTYAKLSEDEKKSKDLEITIDIENRPENDFVKFTIWDNSSRIEIKGSEELKDLPQKCDEDTSDGEDCLPLHQRINCKLIRSFVTDEGELKKENWGLAEMKISAGFLQKKGIDNIAQKGKEVLSIIKAVPIGEHHNLGYEFRIPKPKELLIVGQVLDETEKTLFQKYSIYVAQKLPSDVDFEFVILLDDGRNEFIEKIKNLDQPGENEISLKSLSVEIERLPYRLFVAGDLTDKINAFPFLKSRIVLVHKEFVEDLFNTADSIPIEKKLKSFKTDLYMAWLKHLLTLRGKGSVGITIKIRGQGKNGPPSLQDEIVGEVRKLLEEKNRDLLRKAEIHFGWSDSYLPPTLPEIYEEAENGNDEPEKEAKNENDEPWKNEIKFSDGEISEGFPIPKNSTKIVSGRDKIIYARHKDLTKQFFQCVYFESLSGAASHFQLLESPPIDDYNKKKLLFQIIENALVRVGIVDERVSDSTFLKELADDAGYYWEHYLEAGKVYVIDKFLDCEFGSRGGYRFQLYEDGELRRNFNGKVEKQKIDVLIVHQGVIDKLSKSKEEVEDFFDRLKNHIPFILITSGRGTPENLPKNVKYVPFSDIESSVLSKPFSKFNLTRMVMSTLRGRERSE